MPYEIKRHGHLYSVVNSDTGRIHSLGTSRDKAVSQMRLLYMLEGEKVGDGITPFGRMGGKSKIAKQLIEIFPPHKTFVELFVGAGNIFFRKEKAEINVINDLDKDIYNAMKGLQTRSKYINDNINRNVTRDEFGKIKNKTDAKSIIEKLKSSFFAKGMSWIYNDNKTDYLQFGDKLKGVIILNQSFEKVIKKYDAPDTFFFLDPPYESTEQKDYKDYVDPQQVYDALQGIKGKFMITYNNSSNIRRIFSKYNIKTIKTKYIHTQYVDIREKTELIITNYKIGSY